MASCPVCALEGASINVQSNDDAYDVGCRRCSSFVIDGDMLASCRNEKTPYEDNFPHPAPIMAGIVRNAAERGARLRLSFKTLADVIKQELANHPIPTQYSQQRDHLLRYIGRKIGTNRVRYVECNFAFEGAVIYVESCKWWLTQMQNAGLLEAAANKYRLTDPAWLHLEKIDAAKAPASAKEEVLGPVLQLAAHFEVGDRLGHGAEAKVFAAVDKHLNRDVAIKFFEGSKAIEVAVLEHARVMAATTHPNIAIVHGACLLAHPETAEVVPAIVMERVIGEVLVDWLMRASAAADVLRIGTGILDAIGKYHSSARAHGDLHDENVMVGSDCVKVLDPGRFTSESVASTRTIRSAQTYDMEQLRFYLGRLLMQSALPANHGEDFKKRCRQAADVSALRALFVECATVIQPVTNLTQPTPIPSPPADVDAQVLTLLTRSGGGLPGFKFVEVAAELGVKPSAVRDAVARAVDRKEVVVVILNDREVVGHTVATQPTDSDTGHEGARAAAAAERQDSRPSTTSPLQQLMQHRERLGALDPTDWSQVKAWHTRVKPLIQRHFPEHLIDFERLGNPTRMVSGPSDAPYKRTLGWLQTVNEANAKVEHQAYVQLGELLDGIVAAHGAVSI